MKNINLQELYSSYTEAFQVEVPDEVAEVLLEAERLERNSLRRLYYNKAYYSLDAGDGIECKAVTCALTPCELYEEKLVNEQLHQALSTLPDKQRRRVYAHYILGISKVDIAKKEGVQESAVRDSIGRGLKNMRIYLGNI